MSKNYQNNCQNSVSNFLNSIKTFNLGSLREVSTSCKSKDYDFRIPATSLNFIREKLYYAATSHIIYSVREKLT